MKITYQQSRASEEEVASPCVRNCCLNEQDICLGCFRHMDEIMAWQKLNVRAKKEVLNQCLKRQELHGN